MAKATQTALPKSTLQARGKSESYWWRQQRCGAPCQPGRSDGQEPDSARSVLVLVSGPLDQMVSLVGSSNPITAVDFPSFFN